MARKPEGNHEAYKKSGFLRTTKKKPEFYDNMEQQK